MSDNLPARMGLAEVQTLGALLAKSGYFQDAKDAAQACVKVLAGQELGLPPIASMMGISLIKGKVTLSANLIAALVRQHGYDFQIEDHTNSGCTILFIGKDVAGSRRHLGRSSFTEADARAAGIKSDMYQKYPRNMYFSRAISNGAKWFTPEIFGGAAVYTPDELGGEETGDLPAPEETTPHIPPPLPARRAEPTKPAAPPPADIEPRLAELYANATGFQETVQIITGFKPIISELVGSEADYYRIINSHGMAHGNELAGKTKRQIKQVIRELFDFCTAAAQPPDPPADEDPAWAALAENTNV